MHADKVKNILMGALEKTKWFWHTGIYNRDVDDSYYFDEAFTAAIIAASRRAVQETLEAGVPVFYRDWKLNLDIMEQPDGRKFEICFIPGAPRESNYRVIRELDGTLPTRAT
jgi:hypothetical protein